MLPARRLDVPDVQGHRERRLMAPRAAELRARRVRAAAPPKPPARDWFGARMLRVHGPLPRPAPVRETDADGLELPAEPDVYRCALEHEVIWGLLATASDRAAWIAEHEACIPEHGPDARRFADLLTARDYLVLPLGERSVLGATQHEAWRVCSALSPEVVGLHYEDRRAVTFAPGADVAALLDLAAVRAFRRRAALHFWRRAWRAA